MIKKIASRSAAITTNIEVVYLNYTHKYNVAKFIQKQSIILLYIFIGASMEAE